MTTFLSHEQPTVDAIRAHKYKNNAGGNTAVVEFDREHHNVTNFYIDDPDPARQLLAAAFEAVRILDPDGAADAVFALIEGDALAKILTRAREEEVRKVLTVPGATVLGEVHVCYWCGIETSTGLRQCAGGGDYADKWECADPDPCRRRCADDLKADAAPDTAQPAAACRWCATTEGILLQFGTLDDGNPRWFCGDVKACYERRPIDGTCEVCSIPVTGGEIGPDGVTWLCEDHRADPAAGICPSCGSEDPAQCGLVPGRTGMPVSCTDDWHDGAAPDTAQPEDIPRWPASDTSACVDCGATDGLVPFMGGGRRCYNAAKCAERQAAKAGAR